MTMTTSPTISPLPLKLPDPANAALNGPLMEPGTLEVLLQQLVSQRWSRLQPEYDDPIGMLMNQGARQWTAGWSPRGNSLYLLVWESDSFEQRAWWRFYENGALLFEEPDGTSKSRSALFNTLLESGELPFVSYHQWLDPMLHYNHPPEARIAAVDNVLHSVKARPEIFDILRTPLFEALELDLKDEQWPLLELLKIHRLSHKNPLVRLFQQLMQLGFIRTLEDRKRLNQALSLLQDDYAFLSSQVAPFFRTLFEQAHQEFRQLMLTDGFRQNLPADPDLSGFGTIRACSSSF